MIIKMMIRLIVIMMIVIILVMMMMIIRYSFILHDSGGGGLLLPPNFCQTRILIVPYFPFFRILVFQTYVLIVQPHFHCIGFIHFQFNHFNVVADHFVSYIIYAVADNFVSGFSPFLRIIVVKIIALFPQIFENEKQTLQTFFTFRMYVCCHRPFRN